MTFITLHGGLRLALAKALALVSTAPTSSSAEHAEVTEPQLLWSQTAVWDGCSGSGAQIFPLFNGDLEVTNLGSGMVLLEAGNEGRYQVDATTGKVVH